MFFPVLFDSKSFSYQHFLLGFRSKTVGLTNTGRHSCNQDLVQLVQTLMLMMLLAFSGVFDLYVL